MDDWEDTLHSINENLLVSFLTTGGTCLESRVIHLHRNARRGQTKCPCANHELLQVVH